VKPVAFHAFELRIDGQRLAGRDVIFQSSNPGAKRKWSSLSFPVTHNHKVPVTPQRVEALAESADENTHYEFYLRKPRLQRRVEFIAGPSEPMRRFVTFKRWRTDPESAIVRIVTQSP
jgi:hypothetical protein